MRITIQIVIEAEPDQPPIIQEVAQLEREQLQLDTLGLRLAEAKAVLQGSSRRSWSTKLVPILRRR